MIQKEFEPFYINRLSNHESNKRKFKAKVKKSEFKPKISKKS